MKSKTKQLTVHLTFTDELDLIKGLETIRKQVMARQTNNHSGRIGDVSYDWNYMFVSDDDWREEEINGQWCRVYQSKMNKK